jgi:hypothetical protein
MDSMNMSSESGTPIIPPTIDAELGAPVDIAHLFAV